MPTRTRRYLLVLAIAPACRSTPATPVTLVVTPPPTTAASTDTPPVALPPASEDPSPGKLLRLPDDPHANVFGLAWHTDHWAIGVAYTDVRNTVELRPVTATGIAEPSHTLPLSDYPLALVASKLGDAPWVIFDQGSTTRGASGTFVAHGFGGGEHVVLTLPKRDPGMRESTVRNAWRPGAEPRGAAVYTTSIVRQRTRAELDASRKASRGAPSGSESGFVTLAQTARHYGGGPKSFESARVKETGKVDIGWREVAIGDKGWVGAHWITEPARSDDDPARWTIALHWFDDGVTRKRASTTIPAPVGSSGQIVLAADGTTYLVSDGTDPFGKDSRIVVTSFDASGKSLGDRTLPVSGWIADSMATITCEGHTWLAIDPYIRGTEAVDVIELVPSGPLAAQRVWTGVDPLAIDTDGSRPGRSVFAACGPERVGLAFQLAVANTAKPDPARQDETTDPGVLLVEWPNR